MHGLANPNPNPNPNPNSNPNPNPNQVRPDAPDGMGEGEENTRWSSVGGKGGRRPKRMSAIKDEDDEHGGGG